MKTKNLLLAFTIITVMLTSIGCKKENTTPAPNGSNAGSSTATVYFKNTTSDPYKMEIDGASQGTLPAGQKSNGYTITSGVGHELKATQMSGYVFYPSVYTKNVNLSTGDSYTHQFP